MNDPKLIELVREHPSIYNPKHPQYKDSNVRDNVWAEISSIMKIPGEECKNRWKNIRDTYTRRKGSKKLPTGSARSKVLRKWHLEEHLIFLNLVECERATLTNTATQGETTETQDDSIEYGTQNQEMEEEPDDLEKALDNGNNNSSIPTIPEQQSEEGALNTPSNKRKPDSKISSENIVKLFKKNSDDRAKLLSTILAKPAEQQHPIDVFFQSMAMSVKKMSLESQIRAKMEICQIVGQLELEEIRKTSSSSCSAQYNILSPTPAPSHASSVEYEALSPIPAPHESSVSYQSPPSLQANDVQYMTNVSGVNFH